MGSTEDGLSSKRDPRLAEAFDLGLRSDVASSIRRIVGDNDFGEFGSLSLRNNPITEATPGCSIPPKLDEMKIV